MKFKIFFLLIFFLHLSIFAQGMNKSNSSFIDFLKKVQQADQYDKQALADEFIKQLDETSYPIFENDSTVVLIFKGTADTVRLLGDMTNWSDSEPMIKIEGTDLFYFRGTYEPEARFEYMFELKRDEFPVIDQFNPYKALNALWQMSELAMPGYVRHPLFKDYEGGKKGDASGLKEIKLLSKYLGYSHTIRIFLPADYDSTKKYPSVYFQDGLDYIEYGLAPYILNNMISSGEILPVIAVFVDPPNLHEPKIPNRMTEYGMNDDYVKFFSNELVPFIDSLYSTDRNSSQRLVVGDSYGGLISVYISFSCPEIFGKAYSQSGYFSFSKDKMIRIADSLPVRPVELIVEVGTYEESVGGAFLPKEEQNFTEGNRRFRKILEQKGYSFIYKEFYEGHTWGNWRRHLVDALLHFFGSNKTTKKD